MPKQDSNDSKFQSVAALDARLLELEQERKQLLVQRERLQQPSTIPTVSDLYSPEQKIAICMITLRKTSTLILVHSRQLLDQWKERSTSFLLVSDKMDFEASSKK
jgi:hypothetical protein